MIACKKCSVEKSISEFRVRANNSRMGHCRDCENAYQRDFYIRNPELIRKRKRESMAKKRAEDIEAARAYSRSYHHANRDRQRKVMRAYSERRFFWSRSMRLRGKGRATAKELASIWKSQRGFCALTGERLTRENAGVDHKMPKARGGGDGADNLQWVTRTVNLAKRDLTDDEFAILCSSVMSWIGRRLTEAMP